MQHRIGEFNVHIQSRPESVDLMYAPMESMEILSKEAGSYLRSIGYNAIVDIPPPGWGAYAGLHALIASVKPYMFFIKVLIIALNILMKKVGQVYVGSTGTNRLRKEIIVRYNVRERGWARDWDPSHATQKLDTMIDASHFLTKYMKNKYPNMVFSQTVIFTFADGRASQYYYFQDGEDSDMNIARYKKIFKQTSFEKDVKKEFSITKNFFIKRVDSERLNNARMRRRVYFFLIPSYLISEIFTKYRILRYKLDAAND